MSVPKLRPWLAATAAALGVSGYVLAIPQALAAQPIAVGVLAPKSQILGKAIFNSAELAAAEINAKGGIAGRPLELHEYDTQESATNAAQAFQRTVQQDHSVAVVGIFESEVGLALMPWSSRLKTPLLVTATASPEISGRTHAQPDRFKYTFSFWFNSEIQARQICEIGHDTLTQNPQLANFNRVAILSEDANWTKAVDKTYEACLPKAGFKVVNHTRFAPSTTDFTPIYSKIKSDKANIIMAGVAHVSVPPVVQWHQQQVPALFDGINAAASSSDFWSATNGATNGLITTSAGLSGAAVTSRTAAFYKAYQQRFHINQPAYGAYSTYEAMYALADALKRTQGKAKGDALVKALETTDTEGVMGRIRFYGLDSPFAHELMANADPAKGASVVAFQWQNGKQVIVWPQRLATGKIEVPSFVPSPKS